LNESGAGIGQFIVSGGDASELLEAVDEPLDLVAVTVAKRVQVGRLQAVGAGRNHGYRAGFGDLSAQGIGIIGRIGQYLPGRGQQRGQQVGRLRGIAGLPGRRGKG